MSESLDVFFSDDLISVPVVFGSTNTFGILDQPDIMVSGGLAESTAYSLLVKASDFPTVPVLGDPITVDSVSYIVNSYSKVDDGKIARIAMSKS